MDGIPGNLADPVHGPQAQFWREPLQVPYEMHPAPRGLNLAILQGVNHGLCSHPGIVMNVYHGCSPPSRTRSNSFRKNSVFVTDGRISRTCAFCAGSCTHFKNAAA